MTFIHRLKTFLSEDGFEIKFLGIEKGNYNEEFAELDDTFSVDENPKVFLCSHHHPLPLSPSLLFRFLFP
jgi:hypothetical protein